MGWIMSDLDYELEEAEANHQDYEEQDKEQAELLQELQDELSNAERE